MRVVVRFLSVLVMGLTLCLSHQNVMAKASSNTGYAWGLFEIFKSFSSDTTGSRAQGVNNIDSLEFDYVTIEQGLSQNSVLAIYQDSIGFMWFGTWDGLNKYDGYEVTTYLADPDNPFSLSDNAVLSIIESQSGYIWIGTGNGGLNRFDRDTGQFIHFYHDPDDPNSITSNNILTLYEDRSGFLWIGTSGGGLNRLDPKTEQFISYQNDPSDPNSISSNSVTSIFQDEMGTFWIGTEGGGLNRFTLGSVSDEDMIHNLYDRGMPEGVITWEPDKFTHYMHIPGVPESLSGNDITTFFEDKWGVFWIGTRDGTLNRFDRQTEQFTHYRLSSGDIYEQRQNPIQAIVEDRSGLLWIGMEYEGLFQFDPDTADIIQVGYDPTNSKGLNNNNIRAIYLDRSGIIWVGTNGGGVNKMYQTKLKFVSFTNDPTTNNSLSNNEITSVFEDSFGYLWIGTFGGGLNQFDQENNQFIHYLNDINNPKSLSGNIITAIHEDREGELWIGTAGGGLNLFDRESKGFRHYKSEPTDPNSLSDNNISVIFEDRFGELWIGTYGGGLNRFDRKEEQFSHYTYDQGDPYSLSSNTVHAVFEDKLGTLWVGTNNGLNELNRDSNRYTHYFHDPTDPHSLGDNFILSLWQDNPGMLWVGTNGGGLDVFDREKKIFTHYGRKDGLVDQVIFGILGDDKGNIWLSTSRGLSCFSPEELTFDNYDSSDGMPSGSFNAKAFHKSSRGEIFFGGLGGLVAFYPDNIQVDPYIPPVVLTELTQGGTSVVTDNAIEYIEEVTLKWPNNYFEFKFAALSYIHPQKSQYSYTLEGYENEWNHVTNDRAGRYTNIPEGVYTLRIRGSNHDGVWNEEGVRLKVTVVPPFWATDWFMITLGLVLVVGVVGGYRLRTSRAQARNRELESMVHQRTYEVERRRRVAEGLGEIMELLNSNKSLEKSLDLIVSRAAQLTGASRAFVFRNADELPADFLATYPENFSIEMSVQEQRERLLEWISPLIQGRQPLIIPQIGVYPMSGFGHAGINGGALLCVPIFVDEEIFGGLAILSSHKRSFTKEDLELVVILADQAALAIGNALLRDRIQNMAIMTERNRLARDLHDAVTQTLFSASLIAEALPSLWENNPSEGRQLLEDLRRLSRGALAEMRTLLLELRPAGLNEVNLKDLLRQLVETVTGRTGIKITLDFHGEGEIPKSVQVGLYRIAQEALNNIERHSLASAAKVSLIHIHPGGDGVILQVEDDGCGFKVDKISHDHLGLAIMQERAQAIGAKIEIISKPGTGTMVKVLWKG